MNSNLVIAGNALPLKIFVYGTLIRGFCNHFLMKDCTFIGTAKTVDSYTLYVDNYPYVNTLSDTKTQIIGELYEVSTPQSLEDLDDLEGHPEMYVRSPCRVQLIDTGTIIDAQIYLNNNGKTDGAEFVISGDYRKSKSAVFKMINAEDS